MVDISIISKIIRLPFEILGKYFTEILIIAGAIGFIYWMFKSGRVKMISRWIQEARERNSKSLVDINANREVEAESSNEATSSDFTSIVPKEIRNNFNLHKRRTTYDIQ